MRNILVTSLLFVLLGCAHEAPKYAGIRMTEAELQECANKGGRPEQTLISVQACVWPTRDAGKPCLNRNDCEGYCEAPLGSVTGQKVAGTCTAETSDRLGGCARPVTDGIAMGELCVD